MGETSSFAESKGTYNVSPQFIEELFKSRMHDLEREVVKRANLEQQVCQLEGSIKVLIDESELTKDKLK